MSYSLNSLKGDIWGIMSGSIIGVIKGDTRSLDSSSYNLGIVAHGSHEIGPEKGIRPL